MNDETVRFTLANLDNFVKILLILLGATLTTLGIISYFTKRNQEKAAKEQLQNKMNQEQDLKLRELDMRLTSVEHNMGKLEGIIVGMDHRLNENLSRISDKMDSTTREIINLVIKQTKHEK